MLYFDYLKFSNSNLSMIEYIIQKRYALRYLFLYHDTYLDVCITIYRDTRWIFTPLIYIYIYIYWNRASGREPRSSGGNTSSNPQVSALVPRPVVNGMERMCQRHGSDQTPTLLFESQNYVSINSYNIRYAVEEFLSVIPNSVIVWSLQ